MPKIGMSELAPALAWPKYFYQGFNRQYFRKILADRPIAYWPLWEASGSVAYDISGNAFHGTYANVTLGQDGIGDGRTCPLFDGLAGYVNVFSTGLRDVVNVSEGTTELWCKVSAASVWEDTDTRMAFFNFASWANGYFYLEKKSDNNTIRGFYRAGGASTQRENTVSSTDWFLMGLTWSVSKDETKLYYNGLQIGAADTDLGTWADAITVMVIGAQSTTPTNPWKGNLQHAALFDSALSPETMLSHYQV